MTKPIKSPIRSIIIGLWKNGAAIDLIMDHFDKPFWYVDFVIRDYRLTQNKFFNNIELN